MLFRLRDVLHRVTDLRGGFHETPLEREVVVVLELLDETALLPILQAFCPGVIYQGDSLGPLDHPVEVICPDGVLVFIGRKPEPFSQLGRDERGTDAASGEYPLIAGKDHQMLEIKSSGLQWPHDLETFERLPVERDRHRPQNLVKQSQISRRHHLQTFVLQHVDR